MITDELRKFAWAECPSKHLERIIGIADRIDEELANYIELPKDADGATIRIGDEVEYGHNVGAVDRLLLNESDEPRVGTTFGGYFCGKELHHVQPDSWERIISDATALGAQMKRRTYQIGDFVERCKRLAGEA